MNDLIENCNKATELLSHIYSADNEEKEKFLNKISSFIMNNYDTLKDTQEFQKLVVKFLLIKEAM